MGPSLIHIFTNISEVESQLQYDAGEKLMVLSHTNIFNGQMSESWIKRLMKIKERNTSPKYLDKSKEDRNVKLMLQDLDK